MELEIKPPTGLFRSTVRVPGSKSITNRALMLAAMAQGRSIVGSVLLSDDTLQMARALRALGFAITVDHDARRIEVEGRGGKIDVATADLNIGGAGTAMRFLAGFLTVGRGRFRLGGNPRMRERPIAALIEAMGQLGIDARSESDNGCPPIVIDTSRRACEGGKATIDARLSSQFVSALLMPAPLWPQGLELTVAGETARPFVTMTLRLMEQWGVRGSIAGDLISIPGNQHYRSMNFQVEPDASSASYFAAAAALVGGSILLPRLGRNSLQGDLGFLKLLEEMGARVEWNAESVKITGTGTLRGINVSMNSMPDMVPTLAALAPFASSKTSIREVGFVRHHESDRIYAVVTELRRLGAVVHEFDDGLEIEPATLHPATIETYDDHRIAMAFAIAGLKLPGVRIKNPGCVAKTYPEFFSHLAGVCEQAMDSRP
jgi:3-phosphoshikimate 1-carboxyvinyltransferase